MPFPEQCTSAHHFRGTVSRSGLGALRILGALMAIAAMTFVCFMGIHMTATATGFFYLLLITIIAVGWGVWEATAASVLALLCLAYFFLPPTDALVATGAQDREVFVAFITASIIISQLVARSIPRRAEAADPPLEMERLYALSRTILLMDATRPVAKQIAYQIAQIFHLLSVALYDRPNNEVLRAGPEDIAGVEEKLRQSSLQGTLFREGSTVVAAIRLGGEPVGSIALRGATFSDGALDALTNLVAIGLERARGQEAANRAEAARESQELKSTLLHAIAHEFKTPLTSIKAAATALLSSSHPLPLEQGELATIIDEESDRLARLVNEAIQMARIEGGRIQLNRKTHEVRTLIETAVRSIKPQAEGREIRIEAPADLPLVSVDAELLGLALRQILGNALKYSPPASPVMMRARITEGTLILSVQDHGFGIEKADQGRIFDKFYRALPGRDRAPGAGMGLAITREIVAAHSGEIHVESRRGEGTEFFVSLPLPRSEIVV
ncbi:MAG: sensor histidine kinase [Terriglobia bacterium]